MACEIERPDPRVLFESIKSMFSSNVLGGANIIPESNEWYVVSNDYAMSEQFFSISEQSWRERDPRYACCDNLVTMAANDGFYPKPATFASGYIQMTGVAGSALPASFEATISGQQYISANTLPSQLPTSGSLVVRMRALEPGTDGNLKSGTTSGQLNAAIEGINSTLTIYGGQFCGGAVAEECEQFRTRYLERMRYKPNASLDAVKQKLLEWPCITSVCERGGTCCEPEDALIWQGGIDCARPIRLYPIFDGVFDFGAASQNVIDEIQEWLFGVVQGIGQGQVPWGITGKLYTFGEASVTITIDGMACTSPGTANEIRERLLEFVGRLCPSDTLYLRDLNSIVAQLMAGTGNYDILITANDANSQITTCGDAEPLCDFRITVTDIEFTNPN
jgi:hypothetical protein